MFLCIFFLKDKRYALLGIIIDNLDIYIVNFLKILFRDNRPRFYRPDLRILGCSCEFGYPSGHSSTSFSLFFFIFYTFVYESKI